MAAIQPTKDRQNTLWPIGSKFQLVDAWMRNPIEVKRVNVATAINAIVGEDSRGVRYFAHTDRIASAASAIEDDGDFDDLLGMASESPEFEDLV